MKNILTFFFVLVLVPFMHAQWVIDSYDNSVGPVAGATGPKWSDTAVRGTNFFASGTTSEFNLSNNADHMQGIGSMQLDYRCEATEGWGGYGVRTNYGDFTVSDLPYIDFTTGTSLNLSYKVLTPVNMSATGTAFMELKLAEYTPSGERELWYHHTAIDLSDASGNWIDISMPLVENTNNELGFAHQADQGFVDGILQWHNIKGFEITIVYLTSGNPTTPPTAIGSLLWDNLEMVGNRYTPLETFDTAVFDSVFTVDDMSWAGSGASSVTLGDNSTDFVEGAGSMQLNYMVNCSQSWGGYINMLKPVDSIPGFDSRTALVLYIKNTVPYTGTNDRLTMRFFVVENNTGANEDWVCEVPIDLDQLSDWTRYYMPLVQDSVWTDSLGHQRFPNHGFAQKWWEAQGDQVFNPASIVSWKIELSAGGTEYGPINEQLAGTLLFDVLQQSGFQFADDEAPAAPANIFVIPGSFSNLVTWQDVPGESGEKYSIYASTSPISDLNALNVDLIASNIIHGTQVFDHVLIAPNTNQNVTYYYAITCEDFAGNLSEPGYSTATTNTAKGVTTISEVVPVFVADGNLGEWQAIPHFRMYVSDGTATVAPNMTVTNDADCSADLWLAIDANYLYFAAMVNDDVFFPVQSGTASYLLDSPDLFIGMYDWKQSMHSTYQRGAEPDYHLRFNEGVARNDHSSSQCDSLLLEGADYYFGELFPTGYVVEARISLVDLATKRNGGNTGIDVIDVAHGDRIPVDFGINDNDGTGREGLIFYSKINGDNGWQYPNLWSHTWIGDWVVGVEDDEALVNTFSLSQNYPNPFNPATIIKYSIAEPGLVSLKVYDVLGREVANLVNDFKSAGSYDITFNASGLASGVYMYKIESGSFVESKKMILIK